MIVATPPGCKTMLGSVIDNEKVKTVRPMLVERTMLSSLAVITTLVASANGALLEAVIVIKQVPAFLIFSGRQVEAEIPSGRPPVIFGVTVPEYSGGEMTEIANVADLPGTTTRLEAFVVKVNAGAAALGFARTLPAPSCFDDKSACCVGMLSFEVGCLLIASVTPSWL